MFKILPVGEFNSDSIFHSDEIYRFNIHSNSISYECDNISFIYKCDNNSFNCVLNLIKKCNIYCVTIVNECVNIIHYDECAFKYYCQFYNVVNSNDRFYDSFRKIGIIPDNDISFINNSSILEHFKLINLLLNNVDNLNRIFEGELLNDLNIKSKIKKKYRLFM